jgi:hypothetical protein
MEYPLRGFARARTPHEITFAVGGWAGEDPTNYRETYDTHVDRWVKVEEVYPTRSDRSASIPWHGNDWFQHLRDRWFWQNGLYKLLPLLRRSNKNVARDGPHARTQTLLERGISEVVAVVASNARTQQSGMSTRRTSGSWSHPWMCIAPMLVQLLWTVRSTSLVDSTVRTTWIHQRYQT